MSPSQRIRFLCQGLWLPRDLVSLCNFTFILVIRSSGMLPLLPLNPFYLIAGGDRAIGGRKKWREQY
jgi:hypothetical protein